MRPPIGRRGVTLIELVIAVSLSSLALLALLSLTDTAARHHAHAMKKTSAQMNATLAFKAIEREMSEATYLLAPVATGTPSDTMTACANAQPAPGGGALVPIDAARLMRFFAFCRVGGTFYHHSLTGCPAAFTCGVNPASAVGDAARPVAATFLRPFRGEVIKVSLMASSGGIASERTGSFVVAVAAGMNP